MKALRLMAWKSEPKLLEIEQPEPGPGQVVIRWVAPGPAIPTSTSWTSSRKG